MASNKTKWSHCIEIHEVIRKHFSDGQYFMPENILEKYAGRLKFSVKEIADCCVKLTKKNLLRPICRIGDNQMIYDFHRSCVIANRFPEVNLTTLKDYLSKVTGLPLCDDYQTAAIEYGLCEPINTPEAPVVHETAMDAEVYKWPQLQKDVVILNLCTKANVTRTFKGGTIRCNVRKISENSFDAVERSSGKVFSVIKYFKEDYIKANEDNLFGAISPTLNEEAKLEIKSSIQAWPLYARELLNRLSGLE